MKTKEFIRRVEELGLSVRRIDDHLAITSDDVDFELVAAASEDTPLKICTDYIYGDSLCYEDKKPVFDLLVEYAKTPIEERKEEKKYYLRHRYLQSSQSNRNNILSYCEPSNTFALGNKLILPAIKNQFTLKEIEEIEEKLNTDLFDFELVEVEK